MIIDFHTHIFPDAIADRALASLAQRVQTVITPAGAAKQSALLAFMDANGIDKAVVQPVVTKASQADSTNRWAKELTADGRLCAFGGVYPHGETVREQVDTIAALGLAGVKLHPEYQGFWADAPEMLRLYDYIFSKGLAVLIHAGKDLGMPPPYHSDPLRLRRAVRAMGGGVFIAAHLGSHGQWDDVERYLVGENLYFDTSMGFDFYSEAQFTRIVNAHGADKILFASDYPWSNAAREIARLQALPGLCEAQKALIFHGNAQRLLAL